MTDDEQRKIFSTNINHYIALSGKQQKEVAKELGFSPTTFNTWCVGKIIPNAGKIQKIADYFEINKTDLLDDKARLIGKARTESIVLNVLGHVSANNAINSSDEIISTTEISENMAANGDYFGLQIHGDSMEPRMYDGDIVIVRQQEDAKSGDIVVVMINGNDAICKRLTKYEKYITLSSINPKYEPMTFSNDEITNKNINIIGKVVELRSKL